MILKRKVHIFFAVLFCVLSIGLFFTSVSAESTPNNIANIASFQIDSNSTPFLASQQNEISKENSSLVGMIIPVAVGVLFILIILFVFLNSYKKTLKRKIHVVNSDLYKKSEWLNSTLTSIEDAVITTDENGIVSFINNSAQKLTGFSETEAVGKPVKEVLDLISEETRKTHMMPLRTVLNGGIVHGSDQKTILISRSGLEYSVEITFAPIRNASSRIVGIVFSLHDITQQKNAENALKWEQDFTKNVINNAGIIIMVWKIDGTILKFNKFGEIILGFREEQLSGQQWRNVTTPRGFVENMSEFFGRFKSYQDQQSFEMEHYREDGIKCRVLWNNSILNQNNEISTIISMGIDVNERREAEKRLAASYEELEKTNMELTAIEEQLGDKYIELQNSQKALEVSEERYRLAIEGSNDALWDYDLKTDTLFISTQGKEMLGYEENELITGQSWINLIHPDDLESYTENTNCYFAGKTQYCRVEYRVRTKSGEYKWILSRAKAMWDKLGKPYRMAGSHTDISERKKTEEEIHKLAYYDALTSLPNRTLFMDRLNAAIAQSNRSGQIVVVLYLDLDNFKSINDSQGHCYGDELIRSVAEKMKELIRPYDTVCRLGGDEFVIIQTQIKDVTEITMFAERIMSIFNTPWKIIGKEFFVSASVGISVYPQDGKDAHTLLKNADEAMYKAKGRGKNNYQLYLKSMNDEVLEKVEIERELRYALECEELVVYYQPQVDIVSGNIVGAEALVRWMHPIKGIIPPLRFIPVAEETGLIERIGEWVLRESCTQVKLWQDKGLPPINIAVNLSARQFQQKNLIEMVKDILEDTQLDPKWLELEITESITMKDMDSAILTMFRLKEMGIHITMDDFGTGYSSLNYLKRLPINNLKIDKTFVQGITLDKNEEAIAEAIISLSHSMNLCLTAEGVETEEQLAFLKEHKCDKVQGYLFSRPIPSDELENLLKLNKKFC